MRLVVLGALMAVMILSACVIAASLSADVGRIAKGSAEVKHARIRVLEVVDELSGANLVSVRVTVLVDATGTYRVTVTVSNDLGSTSGSWTGTLTGGQEATVTIRIPSPYLKEGETGFKHEVEVTPL